MILPQHLVIVTAPLNALFIGNASVTCYNSWACHVMWQWNCLLHCYQIDSASMNATFCELPPELVRSRKKWAKRLSKGPMWFSLNKCSSHGNDSSPVGNKLSSLIEHASCRSLGWRSVTVYEHSNSLKSIIIEDLQNHKQSFRGSPRRQWCHENLPYQVYQEQKRSKQIPIPPTLWRSQVIGHPQPCAWHH